MVEFKAKSVRLSGGFRLKGQIDKVFELFSPLGEKAWVPGWSPEMIYPRGVEWERGQIFRTREERGEAIWIVTQLDREGHRAEYHRVEAVRYVARVTVKCTEMAEGEVEVRTEYEFVGLSESGNEEIAGMSEEGYKEKMKRWEGWIGESLARKGVR